jgi:hypothetical protein
MSAVHSGLRNEYVKAECGRRQHPLIVKRGYNRPDWHQWLYCVCGDYRCSIQHETREIIGERQYVGETLA